MYNVPLTWGWEEGEKGVPATHYFSSNQLHVYHCTHFISFYSTYSGAQHNLHIRLCSCRSAITRQGSLEERALLILPDHLSILVGLMLLKLQLSVHRFLDQRGLNEVI